MVVRDNAIIYELFGLTITITSWRNSGAVTQCFDDKIAVETNNWCLEFCFYPMLFDVTRSKIDNAITNVDLNLPEFQLSWSMK